MRLKTVKCRTAGEFLNALSPRSRYFLEKGPLTHVFRGHGDERYGLVPSALRPGVEIRTGVGWRIAGEWKERQKWDSQFQVMAEMNTIRRFFRLADQTGL